MSKIETMKALMNGIQKSDVKSVELVCSDDFKVCVNDTALIRKIKDMMIKEITETINKELNYE